MIQIPKCHSISSLLSHHYKQVRSTRKVLCQVAKHFLQEASYHTLAYILFGQLLLTENRSRNLMATGCALI